MDMVEMLGTAAAEEVVGVDIILQDPIPQKIDPRVILLTISPSLAVEVVG